MLGSGIAPGVLAGVVAAWTQLLGMLSAELFGQFTGAFEPADELYGAVLRSQVDTLGLGA